MAATKQLRGITSKQHKTYLETWDKLSVARTGLDFKVAQLARQIRTHFPKGSTGDAQFRAWAIKYLGVSGPTAVRLLRAIQAIQEIVDNQDWINLGGWDGVTAAVALDEKDRRLLLKRVRAKVKKLSRPLSRATVRNMVDVVTGTKEAQDGKKRPKARPLGDARVVALREWMQKLYSRFELPDMPEAVQKAMDNGHLL